MKQYFLWLMLAMIPVALIMLFLYRLGGSIWGIFGDWRLNKELDELAAENDRLREEKAESAAKRLDNGCEHDFETGGHGFPDGVCCKCGIEQVKPRGPCDHVWKQGEGARPNSYCEKCGKKFTSSADSSFA